MIQYTEEIWRQAVNERYEPIEGYEVSNAGRVKSLARTVVQKNGTVMRYPERLMKYSDCRGYKWVGLSVNDKQKHHYVHKLIALAFPEFCGRWFPGSTVDHLNGIKDDNRAENLCFKTVYDNIHNPITFKANHQRWVEEVGKMHTPSVRLKAQLRKNRFVYADGITQVFSDCACLGDYIGVTKSAVLHTLKGIGQSKVRGFSIYYYK